MNQFHRLAIWPLFICVQAATGFYHEQSMRQFGFDKLSTTHEVYFGYSITYQANVKRLIVGAPKDNVVGQVYTIDVDSGTVSPVPTPQSKFGVTSNERRDKDVMDDLYKPPLVLLDHANRTIANHTSQKQFLLGFNVMAGSNYFVMCAPRNTEYKKKGKELELGVLGVCFVNPTNGSSQLLDNDKISRARFWKPYGWGLHITAIDEVIVGAPAMYEGIAKVVKNSVLREIIAPRGINGSGYAFGYGVTSGNYFSSRDITKLYYAISTPVGTDGHGQVHFFNSDKLKNISSILNGKVNALFGASMCTLKLSGRRDSLLIGAPTFTDNVQNFHVDRGAVYLYVPDRLKKRMINIKIIKGQSDGAYFGKSLANLGDMDGDNMDEVAIGAPYEDEGRGAVYIYSGARLHDQNLNGNQMLSQRVQPEPNKGIMTFGFSLTPLQDYDNNGCNELAVGAPGSNLIILYRCFRYILLTVKAIIPEKRLQGGHDDKYIIKSCFDVEFPEKPEHINEKINVQVKIVHSDVWITATNTNQVTYNETVTKSRNKYCNDIEVTKRNKGDFDKLMTYTITASLLDNPQTKPVFDASRVMLSQRSLLSVPGQISLADCDGPCQPKLSLDFIPDSTYMTTTYTVGSTTEGAFSFVISNKGDTAYTACLLVRVAGVPLRRPPRGCTVTDTTADGVELLCSPTVLLKNGVDWSTGDISVDTSGLTSKDKEFRVSYTLYNHCDNRTDPVVDRGISYLLSYDIDGIKILGKSDPGDDVDVFTESLRGRHTYTITNAGQTNFEGLQADILMKKMNNVQYGNIIIEIEDAKRLTTCQIANETDNEVIASCPVDFLKKGAEVKLDVPFVVSRVADSLIESQNISTILRLHTYLNESRVETQVQFKTTAVPIWIIVTASLIGLLLLMLLGYVLSSLGLLKRKKKGKLEKLKKSVYKQSMKTVPTKCKKQRIDEEDEPLDDSAFNCS